MSKTISENLTKEIEQQMVYVLESNDDKDVKNLCDLVKDLIETLK